MAIDVRLEGLMRGLDPDCGFTSLVEGPVLKIQKTPRKKTNCRLQRKLSVDNEWHFGTENLLKCLAHQGLCVRGHCGCAAPAASQLVQRALLRGHWWSNHGSRPGQIELGLGCCSVDDTSLSENRQGNMDETLRAQMFVIHFPLKCNYCQRRVCSMYYCANVWYPL